MVEPEREVANGMGVAIGEALGTAGSVRTSIAPAAAAAMMMKMDDARDERGFLPGERGHCQCRIVLLWGLSIEWDP